MKNLPQVLLAKTKKLQVKATKFVCSDTEQAIYTNVIDEPISPFTGASFLEKTARKTYLTKEDLAAYQEVANCPSCKTTWIASAEFVKHNEKFNCVVCNEGLVIDQKDAQHVDNIIVNDSGDKESLEQVLEHEDKASDEMGAPMEEATVAEDEAKDIQEIKEDLEKLVNPESEAPVEDKEVIIKEVAEVIEIATPALTEEAILDETIDLAKTEMAAEEEVPSITIEINDPESVVIAPEEVEDINLPKELSEMTEETAINEQGFDIPEKIYTANLTYNLANLLTKEEYKDKVELIASTLNKENPSFYIAVNSIPVAVAEFKKASDTVKAMFSDHDLVLKSLQVTLANSNKEDSSLCLKDFGIRAIVVPIISEKAAVANNVGKVKRDLQAAFKKKEAEMFNVWRESFTTAALMLCKNLLKEGVHGKARSLITKASITETLRSVGITNADMIVEEAFKRGIQRDFGVIVEEALSLYAKTPEARKEVVSFASDAKYQASVSLASNQANISSQPIVAKDADHRVMSSADAEDMTSILDSLRSNIRSRRI